jgi:hypothetical protein
LIIAYYPVQRDLVEALDKVAPVAVVETPTSIDDVLGNFKFVSRLLDADEAGDHVSGVYRDLLRGSPLVEEAPGRLPSGRLRRGLRRILHRGGPRRGGHKVQQEDPLRLLLPGAS